jgi:uncharacterized protein (TIGR03067 family)
MRVRFLVAWLVILSSAAWAHGEESKKDNKKLQGTWLPSEAELAGTKLPEETLKTMKLAVKDDKYTVTVGENKDEGTVKIDATKTPKTMDITGTAGPNKGKTILAIYELKDDTLRVCYQLQGKKRPTEFKSTANSGLFLVTYEREKR